MIDTNFNPAQFEQSVYDQWIKAHAFVAGAAAKEGAEAFCIMLPPPNITGSLHIGHALNHTLQDILVRFERMCGRDVLWQPGTDHAGIATQMVVERQLADNDLSDRHILGRAEFLKRVWAWKETSGGLILEQDKRLGVSCDWSRERFTMDEGLSKAVRKVFVDLYKKGLIYRGKRLVNWDPEFQTAISDLEVENIEVDGHMWHFKYPLAGGETYEYVEKNEAGEVTLKQVRDYICIATTRPETMLGDGAVAVHPSDERYAPVVGKFCEIPLGPKAHRRLIPIITDDYPDPAFGSGAVKITGAHDFNDYEVAKRNNIPMYALMDVKGAMRTDGKPYAEEVAKAQKIANGESACDTEMVAAMNLVPEEYRGLDRFEVRKRVIEDITRQGYAVMHEMTREQDGATITQSVPLVENKPIMQPFGDRSKVVIEPMLTDQWFVKAQLLAKPALEAVKSGKTTFVPKSWENTYFSWMENIQPWCISRQLWWGHQIPAWYGPKKEDLPNKHNRSEHDNSSERETETENTNAGLTGFVSNVPNSEVFCAETEEGAIALAREYYGDQVGDIKVEENNDESSLRYGIKTGENKPYVALKRDPDVLDTWFSSALWPFSTLGWPDETPELKTYYPTSTLVTGFDIIFFWVARMMMMGIHFINEVPFKTVYVHALVRDEKGDKMSKSRGNVIDPLDLIDQYGADATRFTMAAMAAQGRDVKLAASRVEGYRKFVTKLWHAARFLEMNACQRVASFDPSEVKSELNQWILSAVQTAKADVAKGLQAYRFNDAANAGYQFVWHSFCDWFIELAKTVFYGHDEVAIAETRATAAYILDQILVMLHPFMPFVTEHLWAKVAETGMARDNMLVHQDWHGEVYDTSQSAFEEMEWVIELINAIRSVRAQMNVPASAKIDVAILGANEIINDRLVRQAEAIYRLARVQSLQRVQKIPQGSAQIVLGQTTYCLKLADVIDLTAEMVRLEKLRAKHQAEADKLSAKLTNQGFLAKAPEHVVIDQQARLEMTRSQIEQLSRALERLG